MHTQLTQFFIEVVVVVGGSGMYRITEMPPDEKAKKNVFFNMYKTMDFPVYIILSTPTHVYAQHVYTYREWNILAMSHPYVSVTTKLRKAFSLLFFHLFKVLKATYRQLCSVTQTGYFVISFLLLCY